MAVLKKQSMIAFALVAVAGIVMFFTPQGNAQQQGAYTAAQVNAGRAAYQANCAACHAADLSGQGNASALSGGLFIGSWGDKTAGDLVSFLQGAMPPTNPGSLGEQTY